VGHIVLTKGASFDEGRGVDIDLPLKFSPDDPSLSTWAPGREVSVFRASPGITNRFELTGDRAETPRPMLLRVRPYSWQRPIVRLHWGETGKSPFADMCKLAEQKFLNLMNRKRTQPGSGTYPQSILPVHRGRPFLSWCLATE